MKIIEHRFLRGPNFHSLRPLVQAVVDLEDLDERASDSFPGFTDRLLAALPGIGDHLCSLGYPGGFVERLREGTYMAHVCEHLLLELQSAAGTPVAFGRARRIPARPRHYTLVAEYRVEALAEAALRAAVSLVERLCAGGAPDLAEEIDRLSAIAQRYGLGPSTQAVVDAAARRRIPWVRLSEDHSFVELGWGCKFKRIRATLTANTDAVAVDVASDKALTKRLLEEAGLPVPEGRVVHCADEAVEAAARIGAPVAVKPLNGCQGRGVSVGLADAGAVRAAFERARGHGAAVIVERSVEGDDYRVLVVDGEAVACARRRPCRVVGDGRSSVRELVSRENGNPMRGDGHARPLTRIVLDEHALQRLASEGLAPESVPAAGREVRLRENANLSTGGTAEDVTERMHPELAAACVRAAKRIGLDVAGIDLVCRDIGLPLAAQGGAIVEVNASPGIRMHEHPSAGAPQAAGEAIVASLFPPGADPHPGRIPLIAVTGTNGKTTTAALLAHVLQLSGLVTGLATTEGVYINGERLMAGDCTGYWSARAVLGSSEVQAAVLETARGGILRRGLAFDRCSVGMVLNVSPDHLGQDGIDTLDDLAKAKRLLVETASRAAVLNAEDPLCAQMAGHVPEGCELIYFSMDPAHPEIAAHLARGGRAAYLCRDMITLGHGEHRIPLVEVSRLPFTLQGRARHNVANALAATAALWAEGVTRRRMVQGLASFTSGPEQNPLRLNLFRLHDILVILDYAHNEAAYRAIIETGRGFAPRRLVGVATAPGDRSDAQLAAIGTVCAAGFDELVICEMDEDRGRARGETARLIAQGAGPVAAVVLDTREAIRRALARCTPGDLLIVGCAVSVEDLAAAGEVSELSPEAAIPAA